jgi:hypothetical protein
MQDHASTIHRQKQQPGLSAGQKKTPEHLPTPTRKTINILWLLVVGAFVVVMVLSSLSLTAYVVFGTHLDYGCQIILTIFTTTTSFLAGLFITSPVHPQVKNGVAD